MKKSINQQLEKKIKMEHKEKENISILEVNDEEDEDSNEIEEIMIPEDELDVKTEDNGDSSRDKKPKENFNQADFLKQLIGRIDYRLIISNENSESNLIKSNEKRTTLKLNFRSWRIRGSCIRDTKIWRTMCQG